MEAVINFYRLYATPETLSSEYDIILGNVDSGVKSKVCASQYLTINCGSVNVREVYQNALDYTATQFSLYLPFIGFVAMNNRDFMNGTVNITYKIDLLTGTCVALVKAIRGSTNTIIGQYVGDASEKIPLTATSARAMLQGMASLALGVARTMGGDPGGVALGIGGAVRAGQTPIEMSGSIQGNAGALGYKKPYIVIRRNNTTGSGWSNIGLPSNTVTTVSQISGRVVMTDMTIPGGMTQEEEQEIKDLFARGVIV